MRSDSLRSPASSPKGLHRGVFGWSDMHTDVLVDSNSFPMSEAGRGSGAGEAARSAPKRRSSESVIMLTVPVEYGLHTMQRGVQPQYISTVFRRVVGVPDEPGIPSNVSVVRRKLTTTSRESQRIALTRKAAPSPERFMRTTELPNSQH